MTPCPLCGKAHQPQPPEPSSPHGLLQFTSPRWADTCFRCGARPMTGDELCATCYREVMGT